MATTLVKSVCAQEDAQIYLASANPAVWKVADKIGFKEMFNWLNLPFSVRMIYLKLSIKVLLSGEAASFIKELKRKNKIFPKPKIHKHYLLEK